MKKVLLFCLLILAALILGLSSCGKAEYNLTFVVDGKLYATVKAVENEPVKAPDDPEKDGYTFDGWYFDNGVWQMPFATDQPASGEVRVYAKWLCIHAPTDLIIDTAPTCKDEGEGHTECSKCKEILEVTPIDKLTTHTPAAPVTESFTDSTCSAKGSYDLVVYCSACDALISTERVTVEKKPHTEVTDPATAPTCTSTGLTAGVHCSVCGDVLVAQATVPALAHTAREGEYKAPTCTDEGLTVGVTCSVCGEVLEAKESIPATGHTYNSITTPPTCTENGYTTHACHCGFSYVDNHVDALGHSKVTVDAIAPTCTKAGLTLGIYCSECDTVLIAQTAMPALGHTEKADPAIAPTCTTTGLTAGAHCSVCSEVLVAQATVPALTHTVREGEYKAPTCTDEGFTVGVTCLVCSEVLEAKESIPATGHTYNSLTTPPTCTENGYTTHICHCGSSYVDTYVDALGHAKVTVDAVAPTCTKAGLTLGIYCSECDTVLIAQTAMPALGHTEVTDPAIAPTCTTTGLTSGKHCAVCNEILAPRSVLPALGHTEVTDPAVAPTCTTTGITSSKHCAVCNEILAPRSVLPALGHTEVTDPAVAPTCTTTGLTSGKHCAVCKEIFTPQTTVPVTDHSYISHEARAADCENVGWQAYTSCEWCDYSTYEEIPAVGHKVLITSREEETVTNYITENDPDYPFSISGDIITSTNRGSEANNTSATYTIIAKRAFTLSLEYKTSCEADYDLLSIKQNGIEIAKASGSMTAYTAVTIDMNAGDTVTITYTKDASDSFYSDCVFVRLKTSPTEVLVTEKTTVNPATEELVSSLLSSSDSVTCNTCGKTLAENPHEEGDT